MKQQGQFPAVIHLADLNGQNGFKIDGEKPSNRSGFLVSFRVNDAGDFNDDGYSDLIIGAPDRTVWPCLSAVWQPYSRSRRSIAVVQPEWYTGL